MLMSIHVQELLAAKMGMFAPTKNASKFLIQRSLANGSQVIFKHPFVPTSPEASYPMKNVPASKLINVGLSRKTMPLF